MAAKLKASEVIEIDDNFIKDVAQKLKDNNIVIDDEATYTVKEVAALVKKDPQTIRRHIKAGLLKTSKNGKSHIISKNNLLKYIE